MNQKPWTPKETAELIRLRGTGTANQIAIQLNRTKDSVRHKLKWLEKLKDVPANIAETVEEVKMPETQQDTIRPLRKSEPLHVVYSAVEWCPNCKAPVSSWDLHVGRMSRFGCKRPY